MENDHLLAETVEGFLLFNLNGDEGIPEIILLADTLPATPDKWAVNVDKVALALKDGEVFLDGDPASVAGVAGIPAGLQGGGITDIAAADEVALALKDGNVFAWGTISAGSLADQSLQVPDELTSGGNVDAIFAEGLTCAALVDGRVVVWGGGSGVSDLNADPRLQSGVTDLILINNSYCAIIEDGSLAIRDSMDYQIIETLPTSVQQLGYTQLSWAEERAAVLLPSGEMVIWGPHAYDHISIFGRDPATVPRGGQFHPLPTDRQPSD